MKYNRVIPRDLFNEAKLLKCLGFLTLAIHDNELQGIKFHHFGEQFEIQLTEAGELHVWNIAFMLKRKAREIDWFEVQEDGIGFYTTYNSKADYPLEYRIGEDFGYVFDDGGKFTEEFLDKIKKETE